MRQRKLLIDVAIALALACVVVVGYKLAPRLAPQAGPTLAAPAACDLNASACAADLPGVGRVELAITPRPIPLARPLEVSVRIVGPRVERIERVAIEFTGATMDMGYNRVALVAEGDGSFRAGAMLPVCVSGRMNWRATLHIDSDGRHDAVTYAFSAPAD